MSPPSGLNWHSPEPDSSVVLSPSPLAPSLPWSSLIPLSTGFPTSSPAGLIVSCSYQVPSPEAGRSTRVTVAVVDTFVWQALASVAIPGFTINRVCAASLYILGTATRWPLSVRKWTTTALGLLVIPVIIHPIDRWVPLPASGIIHSTGGDKLREKWGVPTLQKTIAAEAGLAVRAPEVERTLSWQVFDRKGLGGALRV